MGISEFHASHIRRVQVSLLLKAPDLDPGTVSERLGVSPTSAGKRGDERRNFAGDLLGAHEHGWWCLSSKGAVESKDINEHFRYLRESASTTRDVLDLITPQGQTYIDVLWESTYLYAGTGPLLDAAAIAWTAALGAGMGFDIYQVDDNDSAT